MNNLYLYDDYVDDDESCDELVQNQLKTFISNKISNEISSVESDQFELDMELVPNITDIMNFNKTSSTPLTKVFGNLHNDTMIDCKSKNKNKNKSKNKSTPDNFFASFKPIDGIIYFLIKFLRPLFKLFNFRSDIVGFISLLTLCCIIYFSYKNYTNLLWLFVFLFVFIKSLDKLKSLSKSKNKKIKHIEMINIIIKLFIYILFFIIFKISLFFDKNNYNFIYLLIFKIITLIILIHHTNKIINKNKTNYNITIYLSIMLMILFYIMFNLKSDNITKSFKTTRSFIDLFTLNENE